MTETGPRPVTMPPLPNSVEAPHVIYINEFVIDLQPDEPLPDSAFYYRGGSLYDFVFYRHPVLGPSMPPTPLEVRKPDEGEWVETQCLGDYHPNRIYLAEFKGRTP